MIGLVGGIGSGKSTAAEALAGLGAFVLDADKVGHALLDQNPCRDIIVEVFGEEVLAPFTAEGERRPVDRKALGRIVFGDPFKLSRLEDILHPTMRRTFERAIEREGRRGRHPAIILDAAILYEAEWDDLCDRVVFVDSAPANRLARVEASRGWTAETLAAREKVQGPLAEKRAEADEVLPNDGTPDDLRAAVAALWPTLLKPKARPRRPLDLPIPDPDDEVKSPATPTSTSNRSEPAPTPRGRSGPRR